MPSQKKIDTVKKLKTKLEKAKAIFLTDYRGLTHQQLEQLKKALKKIEAEYIVVKNRLLKIAIKQCNNATMEQCDNELQNPTAILFSYGDEIAAIKELAKFIKNVQLPKIKIGIFAGKVATPTDFLKLSSLPDKNTLLTMLVGRLNSPISGLHYALSWNLRRLVTVLENIKEKKPKS